MMICKKKTCTRATLEFDSREVPAYPKFTLCSLKWVRDVFSEFQGGCFFSFVIALVVAVFFNLRICDEDLTAFI